MPIEEIAVSGVRSARGETLAVVAGGLIFSAGLTDEHLAVASQSSPADPLEKIRDVAALLLTAAGADIQAIGKIKASLARMRDADGARRSFTELFGATQALVLVGGETCGSRGAAQLEFIAGKEVRPRRIGQGVRLGPLAFSAGPNFEGPVDLEAAFNFEGAGDLSAQAERALASVLSGLASVSADLDDIVKINNTVASWHDYALYNAVYDRMFSGSQSARCSVGGTTEGPLALVQVEGVAAFGIDRQFVDSTQSGVGRAAFQPDPRTVYRSDIGRCKGPHTHGARTDDLIFIAGECPYDANDNLVGAGNVILQTQCTLDNVARCLDALGANLADIVKMNVTLSDARLFAGFEQAYQADCSGLKAARSVVAAPLGQYGILVEIEAIAVRGSANDRIVLTGAHHD